MEKKKQFNLGNKVYEFQIENDWQNTTWLFNCYKLTIVEIDRRTGKFLHYKTSFAGNETSVWNFIKDFLIIIPCYQSEQYRVLMYFDKFFND